MASSDSCWVPHPTEIFLPGKLLRTDGGNKVFETDAGEVTVPAKIDVEDLTDEKAFEGVGDVCSLDVVSEATLLHTLRVRYKRDEVYTNITRILIATNPFKALPIYSSEYVDKYRQSQDLTKEEPHVFGIAADAFQGLRETNRGQAIMISGESGAGKTETTKLVLLYTSEAAANPEEERNGSETGLGDKVLQLNPVVEAFGNAKTVRNNNSSRFGKWIEVLVNPSTRSISGATVTHYLLEVTRVCSQGPGERNYHIFYQLCSDTSGIAESLKVSDAGSFEILKANSLKADGVDDVREFKDLCKAFTALNFSDKEQDDLFSIVAALLHLGNIMFADSGDGASVAKEANEALVNAATTLGVSTETLQKTLCFKRITVGKEVTDSPLDKDKAIVARDSLSMLLYDRLFAWLIEKCNLSLGVPGENASGGGNKPFIGVLDIAGFENFETNMLEQLSINLVNERLQQIFNESVFKSELADYKAEGIEVSKINFADNSDILTLLEGKGGILPILDDATNGVKQTDALYVQNVIKAHEKNPRFVKPKFPNTPKFDIKHFAGTVTYTIQRFLEKNASSQPPEVIELMRASSISILPKLAEEPEAPAAAASAAPKAGGAAPKASKKATVSQNFRKSLNQLIEKLRSGDAHFVRCVKANQQKVPNNLDAAIVVEQLRCSGIFDAVKIRKEGFPIRMRCTDFLRRYMVMVSKEAKIQILKDAGSDKAGVVTAKTDVAKASRGLLKAIDDVQDSEFAIGKTKVFCRDGLGRRLDHRRQAAYVYPALKLQAFERGRRVRDSLKKVKEVQAGLKSCLEDIKEKGEGGYVDTKPTKRSRASVMENSLTGLDVLVEEAQKLPMKLPAMALALKVRARLHAEAVLTREMQNAATSIDLAEIEALLARADSLSLQGPMKDILIERLDRLRIQWKHRAELQKCSVNGEEEVQQVLEAVTGAGLNESSAWLLEDGPQLFTEAEERLKVLVEERKAAEEAARKAAEEEARRKAEEEARRKAEEEARLKAEEEARIKAEEEARIKAEEEARIKAEEEARMKAEEEARRKAEEEARIKAEEEARKKAEEEARIKAEEEARMKADQEEQAKIKAEQEARQKAEQEEQARIKAEKDAEEAARQKAEQEEQERIKAEKDAEQAARQKADEEARKKADQEAQRIAIQEAKQNAEREERAEAIRSAAKKVSDKDAEKATAKKNALAKEASEHEKVSKRIWAAFQDYDAKDLKEALREAGEMGLSMGEFEEAHQMFLNLQTHSYLEEQIEWLTNREVADDDDADEMWSLLALSNLNEQLESLGFKEEPVNAVMKKATLNTFEGMKPKEAFKKTTKRQSVANKCFGDLTNYSRLKNPMYWGKSHLGGDTHARRGSFIEVDPHVDEMLGHDLELPEMLTECDESWNAAHKRMFTNLLRCMGDKPSAYIGDKERPLIEAAQRSEEACDELYVQVMKQLTRNPAVESIALGWELLDALVREVPPSGEISLFLRAFVAKQAELPEAPQLPPPRENEGRRAAIRRGVYNETMKKSWGLSKKILEMLDC